MPPVLNGLDLHIKSGETVALVGPSGGGKSTLIKLLHRLYDPLWGRIFLDDRDIKDIKLACTRKHFSSFTRCTAENIGYRDLMGKINMEQVEHAAKIANAEEFILTFRDGYETDIGQRGSLLSGGQKQRKEPQNVHVCPKYVYKKKQGDRREREQGGGHGGHKEAKNAGERKGGH